MAKCEMSGLIKMNENKPVVEKWFEVEEMKSWKGLKYKKIYKIIEI